MHINRGAVPPTRARVMPACGRCPKCHPGRQFGGDEKCRSYACTCHRTNHNEQEQR